MGKHFAGDRGLGENGEGIFLDQNAFYAIFPFAIWHSVCYIRLGYIYKPYIFYKAYYLMMTMTKTKKDTKCSKIKDINYGISAKIFTNIFHPICSTNNVP